MEEIIIKNQPILSKVLNKINNTKYSSQAYILYGNSKEKLKEYALLFSKILVCPHNYQKNCEKCNICMRIDNNNFEELKIIEPINYMIKKDEILKLRNLFSTQSIEGRNQVYIITDVETLNISAANSILKFLEEPDSNSVAIFTTTNLDGVIKTILSRCQTIKINNLKNKYGIEFIKELTFFDEDTIYKIIDFTKLIEKDITKAIADIKHEFIDLFDDKQKLISAINVMLLYYKDMLNYKISQKCVYFESNDVKTLANKQKTNIISKKISFILENISKLEYNVNVLLFMENLIIGIGEIKDDKSNRS